MITEVDSIVDHPVRGGDIGVYQRNGNYFEKGVKYKDVLGKVIHVMRLAISKKSQYQL